VLCFPGKLAHLSVLLHQMLRSFYSHGSGDRFKLLLFQNTQHPGLAEFALFHDFKGEDALPERMYFYSIYEHIPPFCNLDFKSD
jgi:hypothetical protein